MRGGRPLVPDGAGRAPPALGNCPGCRARPACGLLGGRAGRSWPRTWASSPVARARTTRPASGCPRQTSPACSRAAWSSWASQARRATARSSSRSSIAKAMARSTSRSTRDATAARWESSLVMAKTLAQAPDSPTPRSARKQALGSQVRVCSGSDRRLGRGPVPRTQRRAVGGARRAAGGTGRPRLPLEELAEWVPRIRPLHQGGRPAGSRRTRRLATDAGKAHPDLKALRPRVRPMLPGS
jgi:hypothetical protein